MATEILTIVNTTSLFKDSEGDLSHLYCACDEFTALCGWDLTNADEDWDEESICVVCDELDFSETFVCPKCGE